MLVQLVRCSEKIIRMPFYFGEYTDKSGKFSET